MDKKVVQVLGHYTHPVKRAIIDYLIDNPVGGHEVAAIARMLYQKFKTGKYEKASKQTTQFLRGLKADDVIIQHPRDGVCVYYFTNPDYITLINDVNELIENSSLLPVSHSHCSHVLDEQMQ